MKSAKEPGHRSDRAAGSQTAARWPRDPRLDCARAKPVLVLEAYAEGYSGPTVKISLELPAFVSTHIVDFLFHPFA
jgi:hypothetical protein